MKRFVIDLISDGGQWYARPMIGTETLAIDGKDVFGEGVTIQDCLANLSDRWADYAIESAIKKFQREPSND